MARLRSDTRNDETELTRYLYEGMPDVLALSAKRLRLKNGEAAPGNQPPVDIRAKLCSALGLLRTRLGELKKNLSVPMAREALRAGIKLSTDLVMSRHAQAVDTLM